MRKRRVSPATVRTMAHHRGLHIYRALRGGWFVTLSGAPWGQIVYCTHDWDKVAEFIKRYPILIKRSSPAHLSMVP